MRLYVGNVSWVAEETELREHFGQFGNVARIDMMKDRDTGKFRGFAFVDMNEESEASQAIAGLNGIGFMGRPLTVTEAKPRPQNNGRAPQHSQKGRE